MKNWVPKKALIISSLAVTIFSVVLYFGGLFIVLKEVKKIENYYSDAESRLSKEERVAAIKNLIETNKGDIQILREFFIRKGDEVKFIEQIEAIAKESEVKFEISSIDVKQAQQPSFKEDVSIKVNMEGYWNNIMNFVEKLEKMSFGLSVQNMGLDYKETMWFGSVNFVVFREK